MLERAELVDDHELEPVFDRGTDELVALGKRRGIEHPAADRDAARVGACERQAPIAAGEVDEVEPDLLAFLVIDRVEYHAAHAPAARAELAREVVQHAALEAVGRIEHGTRKRGGSFGAGRALKGGRGHGSF